MAFTTITVTNGIEIKKVPLGFSWTTFFFGGIPALIRQDWLVGLVLVIMCIFTWGIAGIIAAFFYNKIYAKSLFSNGYNIHMLPNNITPEQVKIELGLLKFPNE